jgi:hypothetical protein
VVDLASDVLAAIDKLLADRPETIGPDFSEATRRLVAWRECCIARWRKTQAEDDRRSLERVNAAVSVIVGGQFPLGGVKWDSIESVRRDLADLERQDWARRY